MIFVFVFSDLLTVTISKSIHVTASDSIPLFFMAESCSIVYMYHIFLILICQQTCRLFPYLGYCELCCYELRGDCIFLNYSFIWIYVPGEGL